jgi:3-methyl-2-oxobutanoate hydroxymethyltransferase
MMQAKMQTLVIAEARFMAIAAKPVQTKNGDTGADAVRPEKPVTVPDFLAAKSRGQRLTMLTAYDYTFARLLDEAGVDGILVGDSLGMVVQGHADSLSVTLEEMIYHTRIVARGVRRSLLVTDMPFMSYQISPQQALENAGRLVKEAGAHAVKLEGGSRCCEAIAAITAADIPVMAHIGLTPQSVRRLGGFKVQRDEKRLLSDARAVEQAGAFAVVVECVPAELARSITAAVHIPTIGIGAGNECDGQILVVHDMLGLFQDLRPKFVKNYADLGGEIVRAVQAYCREVRTGQFPAQEHEFR